MADGDDVLRDIEGPPGWIGKVVGLGCWPLSAPLTDPSGPFEDERSDGEELGMPKVLGVSAVSGKRGGSWIPAEDALAGRNVDV